MQAESAVSFCDDRRTKGLENRMRLVCPNCAAKYEVADDAIPEDGRDVQCANCGKTWFQERAEPEVERVEEPPLTAPDPDPDPEEAAENPLRRPTPRPEPAPTDPSVLDILRREAELETERRNGGGEATVEDTAEQTEVEAEPTDLVPDTSDYSEEPEPSEEAEDIRPAPVRPMRPQRSAGTGHERPGQRAPIESSGFGFTEITPDPPADAGGEIPDLEELNASLRSTSDETREEDNPYVEPRKKGRSRGNRFGFYLALLIFLILLAAYALNQQIAAVVPDSAPYLERYTEMVDAGRVMLAAGFAKIVDAVRNLLAQYL
jgi:predicted Zn finger-like uncharacterized protein